MAHIEITLSALGVEPPCTGCGRQWRRGDTMSGVKYADADPAGWFCRKCIDEWKRTKRQPGPTEKGR